MRLTRYTDLALRAVMRLAVLDGDQLVTTRQIAESMNVPYTHMAKAVAELRHLGVVEARRGRHGGLSLTAAGRDTGVGELIRTLENDREVVVCEGDTPCPLSGACRLRNALRQAQMAFYASLDAVTVADLVKSPAGPVLLTLGAAPVG
ncbi:RrF2 family transcriptional regulator [Streptomyces sp. NPDC001356]